MARKPPKLSNEALRAFRHHVSVLRSKGLVSKRVDARKQRPTRYMTKKVRILSPVLHGEATGVKVHPDLLKQYKEAGFNIVNRRVIVEKTPEEISRTRKGLPLMRRHLGGQFVQERLVLPFGPRNIEDFRKRVTENPSSFSSLKEPGDAFAFKIFGNNSLATFEDIELLLDYLEYYSAFSSNGREEAWNSLQFFRVAPGTWRQSEKRRRTVTEQDRRDRPRQRYPKVKGERIYKQEEAERKRIKRATDLAWRQKERQRDKLYRAAKRAADPEATKQQRLKEIITRRERRRAAKADERNGY